jgi:hypothetical protein
LTAQKAAFLCDARLPEQAQLHPPEKYLNESTAHIKTTLDGFNPNGDLPNVNLVWEDQNNRFGADFEVWLLEISFSRISQQFEDREMS